MAVETRYTCRCRLLGANLVSELLRGLARALGEAKLDRFGKVFGGEVCVRDWGRARSGMGNSFSPEPGR